MITDAELKDALVFSVMADDIGLYEAFWEVPNGEIYDDEFGFRKEKNWEDVAGIVYELIKDGFLSVNFGSYRESERVSENLKYVIYNKQNWEPFDTFNVKGYFLSEGDETIARRASGRSIRESFGIK